jgi:ABC-type antimicrobial peptide transport system permease subunit
VPPTYLATLDVPLAAGRFLAPGDDPDLVCVVDESVASAIHPGVALGDVVGLEMTLQVGEDTRVRRIVGVLADPLTHRAVFESFDESRSARTLTSALLSFRNVYVPETALGSDELSGISVVASSEDAVDVVAERLRTRWPAVDLEARFPTSTVAVFVRRDWMDLLGASSQSGAFLSNLVWIIIVGVAVVMVSTLDLITIRERYDELAIRRVEGARRSDIAWQVMVEGVLLAVAGGIAGLPLGLLGAKLLRDIVQFPFRFEMRYALLATGIAALLGLVAAVLPARHAAGLQPVRVLTRRRT